MALDDITIRTDLRPGDLGYLIHLHGRLYAVEYGYDLGFEAYVAEGLLEFYREYAPARDRVWLAEDRGETVGSLVLKHRGEGACQLRYFLLKPEYRGFGLGSKLLGLFMAAFRESSYRSSFLWTTDDLPAAGALYRRSGFVLTESKPSLFFGKQLMEQRYDLVRR